MEKLKVEGKSVAIIGFSVNPEIIAEFPRMSDKEKEKLKGMTCQLGGTSANVAKAMSKMGLSTTLFTLTGDDGDFYTHCLRFAIENTENIFSVNFPILEQGHMGFIPIDGIKKTSQVFGYKGMIQQEKIADCVKIIQKEKRKVWRIATGVRPAEVELVKALFGDNHKGFRYLNPRMDLIQSKDLFFDLLKQTDVLVLNHTEYEACTHYKEIGSRSDIQKKFGVSLVVVTKDKDGGKYSLSNNVTEVTEKFDAYSDYIFDESELFPTGTGDWFGGSLISFFVKIGKSILEITEEEIRDAIYFAAKVAGKKITMMGAGNGPRECDL